MASTVKKAPSMEQVNLTKDEKDVRCLKKLARFVIEIDEANNISVTNNQSLVIRGERYAPIISVVVAYSDGKTSTVPALEIGYKRARPYRRVHKNRNKILIQTRKADYQLSVEQFKVVYPYILKCLETILIETRMNWKTSEPWFYNGRYYERGGANYNRQKRCAFVPSDATRRYSLL